MHKYALPHMVSRKTSLVSSFSEKELRTIELFKKRVISLIEAREKYETIPICTYETDQNDVWKNFSAKIPDDDNLLQLFTRFRFFYLQKEPTEFGKVLNIIRKKVKDEWARNYLDWINLWYKIVMKQKRITGNLNHPTTNRDIIDYWFNSEYFHSDLNKTNKLKFINDKTGIIASKFQLFVAVVSCSQWIIYLFVTINITDNDHLYI